ncbi:mannose-1-phosphate guanylyltransferase, partial [Novosphingobium flavum]
MDRITPVVLCGGSGTRLWPRSRAAKPKPFLPLVGEGTLFEATLAR